MKNFAIGCLVVVVVLAVAGGGVVWFKVIKPGMEMAGSFVELGKQFESLEKSVENRAAFRPPGDGVLNETQLVRFLSAQRQMTSTLEGRLDELKSKYESLDQRFQDGGNPAEFIEAFGAWKDMVGLLVEAKHAQVEALNASGFSLQEYAWVRKQIYGALGKGVAVAALRAENAESPGAVAEVPDQTVTLVEPYREELLKSHVLAWWGL